MAQQSLFSILSRAPWWVSVGIAAGLFALTQLFLPALIALSAALPFLAIAGYAAFRQLRKPGAANVAEILARLRAMPWENFSAVLAEAFRRDGYGVDETAAGAADFTLHKKGRVTLVSCRRWKVAQTGIAPLREIYDAKEARDAHACVYVALGEFTDNARAFATDKSIELLTGAALAGIVARVESKRRWFWR